MPCLLHSTVAICNSQGWQTCSPILWQFFYNKLWRLEILNFYCHFQGKRLRWMYYWIDILLFPCPGRCWNFLNQYWFHVPELKGCCELSSCLGPGQLYVLSLPAHFLRKVTSMWIVYFLYPLSASLKPSRLSLLLADAREMAKLSYHLSSHLSASTLDILPAVALTLSTLQIDLTMVSSAADWSSFFPFFVFFLK